MTEPKPTHYKVICISMYNDDIRRMDSQVDALKKLSIPRISRSSLIRYALQSLPLHAITAEMVIDLQRFMEAEQESWPTRWGRKAAE